MRLCTPLCSPAAPPPTPATPGSVPDATPTLSCPLWRTCGRVWNTWPEAISTYPGSPPPPSTLPRVSRAPQDWEAWTVLRPQLGGRVGQGPAAPHHHPPTPCLPQGTFTAKNTSEWANHWNHTLTSLQVNKIPSKYLLILYFCSCFWTSESSLLRRRFRPVHLCVSLLLLLKRKVFTSSFFDMCLTLGVGVENMKDIQSKKTRIFTKIECFSKDTLKFIKKQLQ